MAQPVQGYTQSELARVDMVLFRIYDKSNSKRCLELSMAGPDKDKIDVFSVEAIVRKALDEHTPTLDSKSILERIDKTMENEGSQLCYRVNGSLVVDVNAIPEKIRNEAKYANAIRSIAGNPSIPVNNKTFISSARTTDNQPMLVANICLGNLLDFVQGYSEKLQKGSVNRAQYGS
jgi:hypothetical protein